MRDPESVIARAFRDYYANGITVSINLARTVIAALDDAGLCVVDRMLIEEAIECLDQDELSWMDRNCAHRLHTAIQQPAGEGEA